MFHAKLLFWTNFQGNLRPSVNDIRLFMEAFRRTLDANPTKVGGYLVKSYTNQSVTSVASHAKTIVATAFYTRPLDVFN